MATAAEIKVLQTTVNRYSKVAGFLPLDVDGQIGAKTVQATLGALQYVASGNQDTSSYAMLALMSRADQLHDTVNSSSALAANITDVAGTLMASAQILGLPVIAPPKPAAPSSSSPSVVTASMLPMLPMPSSGGNFLTSIWVSYKLRPLWQQVAIAAGAMFGLLWARKRFFAARKGK